MEWIRRLLGPFSAAGAVGHDVTAPEPHREPIGAQEGEAPEAESILDRCAGEDEKGEEERRRTWAMKTVSGEGEPCSRRPEIAHCSGFTRGPGPAGADPEGRRRGQKMRII